MIINSNPYEHGPTDHNANSTNYANPTYGKTETPAAAAATTAKEEAITDLYMSDGDDYYIDDTAFSDAQMGTGENETAASVIGSGVSNGSNGSSETNSNINTGVFGGSSKAAHPGASLW